MEDILNSRFVDRCAHTIDLLAGVVYSSYLRTKEIVIGVAKEIVANQPFSYRTKTRLELDDLGRRKLVSKKI